IPGVPSTEYPVIPYPFDPNNPDVPVTPTPDTVIPYVPGYVPVDPNTNQPLQPVDPEDPSKGYIPPTPSTPGVNTLIPYIPTPTPTPTPTPNPGAPKPNGSTEVVPNPEKPVDKADAIDKLPNTGESNSILSSVLGMGLLLGAAASARRRKGEK
ncbi:TPA: LPXTG cell wall anchor domain-containing protein, partial [Streptococcus suis]